MQIHQIRNATLRIRFGGSEFLVDPWLASMSEGITFRKSGLEGEVVDPATLDVVMPRCELPLTRAEVLAGVDAVVVTHVHPDHIDMAPDGTVGAPLDHALPVFVQNGDDAGAMRRSGFSDVRRLEDGGSIFRGVTLRRTPGRHGTKTPCGPASGVFFSSPAETKTLWIAGDTVWYPEVEAALATLRPDAIVLNACAAQFRTFGRLIMDDADVEAVCRAAPDATVIVSHMDTVAHATLTRKTLRAALERRGLADRVLMPDDGEEYCFN